MLNINEPDQEKPTYITPMNLLLQDDAFWDKNVCATYKKLVNRIFTDSCAKQFEAYVDDK